MQVRGGGGGGEEEEEEEEEERRKDDGMLLLHQRMKKGYPINFTATKFIEFGIKPQQETKSAFLSTYYELRIYYIGINAQSASLRSLVAAESKAAEIKAAVACFESVCQLLTWTCLECVCQL